MARPRSRERDVDDVTYEALAHQASREMAPDVNLAAMEMIFHLIRVTNRIQRDLEVNVHRPAGMTLAAFRVLVTIRFMGKITPAEVARQSSISPPSASSVLNTLEKYEFIRRAPAAGDGRSVIVELTPKGAEVIAELFRRNNQREVDWLAALTEPERSTLVELLRKILHHSPPPPSEALVHAPPVRHVPPRNAD
jgi:DNA-binding MarR family transcriptional regulator